MSSTRMLYFLPGKCPQHVATERLWLGMWGHSLMVPPAQLREVGQLLDADDAVVEGGLEALGHRVGQDDSNHNGQDVRDLPRQLEDDDGGGHSVGNSTRQRGRPCQPQETWAAVSWGCVPHPRDILRTIPLMGGTQGHQQLSGRGMGWDGDGKGAVLTHHGVAPWHDAVGVAVGVDPIREPGCHALPNQPPKGCPCPQRETVEAMGLSQVPTPFLHLRHVPPPGDIRRPCPSPMTKTGMKAPQGTGMVVARADIQNCMGDMSTC